MKQYEGARLIWSNIKKIFGIWARWIKDSGHVLGNHRCSLLDFCCHTANWTYLACCAYSSLPFRDTKLHLICRVHAMRTVGCKTSPKAVSHRYWHSDLMAEKGDKKQQHQMLDILDALHNKTNTLLHYQCCYYLSDLLLTATNLPVVLQATPQTTDSSRNNGEYK